MRPVRPGIRTVAVFLVALLLPLQGAAAACAQICARVAMTQDAAVPNLANDAMHQGHETAPGHREAPASGHDHCGQSELGAGKCCQAHVFAVDLPGAAAPAAVRSFERGHFVARWASFIPEEPSPPPIAAFRA